MGILRLNYNLTVDHTIKYKTNSFSCTIDNKINSSKNLYEQKYVAHTIHSLLVQKLYSIFVCGGHLVFMLITEFLQSCHSGVLGSDVLG